ncbi:MAG TPA: CbrC family protein [Opitutaceae bacterium]|nr:CbrC family protein [Opitutaceae bacterium]
MAVPTFKYHPDPIATKSIVASDVECICCGKKRGFIYAGPVFAEDELADSLCPWCIADGSAHERFKAEFTDSAGVNSYGRTPPVPKSVIEEVSFRTPGFMGWQQEHWVTCCDDAAAYLGRAGKQELETKWPTAIPGLMEEAAMTAEQWENYVQHMDKDGSPTAYIFRCLHCEKLLGYSDCD